MEMLNISKPGQIMYDWIAAVLYLFTPFRNVYFNAFANFDKTWRIRKYWLKITTFEMSFPI